MIDVTRLAALAEDLDVGPSVRARMLIHSSLSGLLCLFGHRQRQDRERTDPG